MWNETCLEGKRLLDCYLMALTNDELARREMRYGNVTVREAAAAHDDLYAARNRYWEHVQQHLCRTKLEILTPPQHRPSRARTGVGTDAP